MPEHRPLRVFLCYAAEDRSRVRELYDRLEAEEWIEPWLDIAKLFPGKNWRTAIREAIERSDCTLVCLSNNSATKRGFAHKEMRYTLEISFGRPEETSVLLPIRLEDCDVPGELQYFHWIDYFDAQKERYYQILLKSLRMQFDEIVRREPSESAYLQSMGHSRLEPKEGSGRDDRVREPKEVEDLGVRQQERLEVTGEGLPAGPVRERIARPVAGPLSAQEGRQSWAGLEFVTVPRGIFIMGSHEKNRLAFADEKPRQRLDIPYDFWIGRFLVTREQFSQFIDAAGYSRIKHANWQYTPNHPVIDTPWKDVQFYLKWLNETYGSQLSNGLVYRLPTEAEWEKAARGVQGREWPWGNHFDRSLCNSTESELYTTTPVGTYSPPGDSPYGCADMAGDSWEWTQSLYRPYPYNSQDGREIVRGNGFRVIRGGSFYRDKRLVRCAYRKGVSISTFAAGFRVVVAPPTNP